VKFSLVVIKVYWDT